jgi:hypothetical protein
MPRIAFYTFGILHEPYGHPRVQGFVDMIQPVFEAARKSEGFIDLNSEPPGDKRATPKFYDREKHAAAPATLTWWKDLESVFAFAYSGLHAEALKHRHEWALKPEWPTYAAWWIDDDHIPTRQEAVERIEHLHDNGSTPFAFDFRKPFDASGNPAIIEKNLRRNKT